ncbi:MAG: 23S rRNA (adenine(2503)-C(2))-methyltransferase RlmN [Candidatus Sumerlaeota bacterium]|nr:23S rRNA (adenine(2503)-C(2))-methyltransferase RlmN [Candidatus Sumerlaeota bacterium]
MLILLGQSLTDLDAAVQRAGFPGFRAKQLFHWIYQKGALSFDEMTNLPKDFRAWLAENTRWGGAEIRETIESSDGAIKLLWGLEDGLNIEGVLMPEEARCTLCVSSQAGCALGCEFCVTGTGGLKRDCTAGEMLGQVLRARRLAQERGANLTHLVFMGMGEPLLNLDEVLRALRLIISPQAVKISPRRVTVSTAGIVPGIRALADADLNVKLAISLNATDDETRCRLMPIARRYPLDELLEACRDFQRRSPKRHRITFEYVLLSDVNDTPEDARRLVRLLSHIPCKVNLIPYNPDPRLPFERPSEDRINAFRDFLLDRNFTVAVRYSKGLESRAACGQLAMSGTTLNP